MAGVVSGDRTGLERCRKREAQIPLAGVRAARRQACLIDVFKTPSAMATRTMLIVR